MNQADDKRDDDEAWLEALAGRQTLVADGRTGLEAEALRRALLARRDRLEAEVPQSGEALYERIIDEIEATDDGNSLRGSSSGISGEQVSRPALISSADSRIEHEIRSPDHFGWWARRSPLIWGFASIALVAVIAVPIWIGSDNGDDELILRSGPNVTVQIVSDPELRAKELSDLLETAGIKPDIDRREDGAIVLLIESNSRVLDLLASQRLMPQPKAGKVVVWLEKANARNP